MSPLQPSHPIFASRLRKQFNKQHVDFSIGDLIQSYDGVVAEFQGISTHFDSTQIAVNAYKVDEIAGKKIYSLPENFMFEGRVIPVQMRVIDRPATTHQSYDGGYPFRWSD